MEKFCFLLVGKEYKLKTDHKAIECFKQKPEFGSRRVRRWFERLDKFNFKVLYKKVDELIGSDALSGPIY